MKKLVFSILMGIMLLFLHSAVADTTLTMWCIATESDANRPAYIEAIAAVEAAHPGLEIRWHAYENDSYKTRIRSAMANPESLPDIFFTWAGAFCGDFVAKGNVYCLEEAYQPFADQLPSVMMQNASYGEVPKPYGVPLTMNVVTLFVNMDLLARAGWTDVPKTYEALMQCCDDLVAAGITPFGCSGNATWCVTEYLEPIIVKSIGNEKLKKIYAGEASWNDPDIAAAVDILQNMIKKDYFDPNGLSLDNDTVKARFIAGAYAFYQNGSWNCHDIGRADGNFRVASFPVINDEKATYSQLVGGPADSLAVSSHAADPAYAAQIAFELGKEISHYAFLLGSGLPAWTPDYDTSGVTPLVLEAADMAASADGMVLFGDTAMSADPANEYLGYVSKVYGLEIDGAEFVTSLSGEFYGGSGSCGENARWELDDTGTLTISGYGDMDNYDEDPSGPWHYDQKGIVRAIVVEEGITGIGDYAFAYCRNVTSITLPESVTHIGTGAFRDTAISNIDLPQAVSFIGPYAFSSCDNLTGIVIPETISEIHDYLFSGCDLLSSVVLPENLTSIGEGAFSGCQGLVGIDIPNSVTRLGSGAFEYCTNLNTLLLPSGLTEIGERAFADCYGLTEINIPHVSSIGPGVFTRCRSLQDIYVASTNRYYTSQDGVLFTKNMKKLVQYPTGRLTTTYSIPASVKNIGGGAFAGAVSLTDLIIPEGIVTIGESAFWGCTKLNMVSLPNSIQNISSLAFYDTGLREINYYGTETDRYSIEIGANNTALENAVWHYLTEELLNDCLILPSSLQRIEEEAFSFVRAEKVYIPESVVYIDKLAFDDSCITTILGNTAYIEEYASENGYDFIWYWIDD